MNNERDLEELAKAISWKLYVEHDLDDYKQKWKDFAREQTHQDVMRTLCQHLGKIFSQMLAERLNINSIDEICEKQRENIKFFEELWQRFVRVGSSIEPRQQDKFRQLIRELIKELLSSEISSDSDLAAPTGSGTQERNDEIVTDNQQQREAKPTSVSDEGNRNTESVNQEVSQRDILLPPSLWKYQSVSDKLEPHSEYDCNNSDKPPDGMKLIGARVRGKSHKHNGTNCDDWFEFAVSNNWTIIAVSDGAGSKKFSRVGAKVSCQAAVNYLADFLKDCKINDREIWSVDSFKRDELTGAFSESDLEQVQKALHEAMKVAYNAIKEKADECYKLADYLEALGRRVDINDFSATLLLTVHTTVKYKEADYSFVLTCQVGDGMIAAVNQDTVLNLLGQPDRGEYSGQTEFITSQKKLEKHNLMRKTFPFFSPIKALMVMTDGVADDYFPNDPGMLQLYGDLILNQVIEIKKPEDSEIKKQLEQTKLLDSDGVKEAKPKFLIPEEVITKDDTKQVRISYVERYAQELERPMLEFIASPALLWAGAYLGEGMCNEADSMQPEEKLQLWLDSYYRRGSFDDRTLVVLYREEV
ncbi:PP2C family serine/threonine-protein phosphatase [Microcoleus sp. CAWBG640]|uniref:PP2C family serine/threonine-protein phosphatase n=1 Tax=Microcoleus sp. CAWBG640 TaxID=2841653 RepID=UPI00312B9FFF